MLDDIMLLRVFYWGVGGVRRSHFSFQWDRARRAQKRKEGKIRFFMTTRKLFLQVLIFFKKPNDENIP
jgi:hypothetical protein